MRILIIGSKGMLANKVLKVLTANLNNNIEIFFTTRNKIKEKNSKIINFNILKDSKLKNLKIKKFDYIINCAGVIKPFIDEKSSLSICNAITINSLFPRKLSEVFSNSKIIQITTDCVFSGAHGRYLETSDHDPIDIYGKSKSLGEVTAKNVMNIRCSIIGKEINNYKSLISWVLSNSDGDEIKGFTNHLWNGVSTDIFAKLCLGIIKNKYFNDGSFHLVPKDIVSKYELIKYISDKFEKKLIINKFKTKEKCDRSILTHNKKMNLKMWKLAGYSSPLTIKNIINEIE
ncbi:sugar nucleotide-binding protein [Alphaproteobacteria bacterium]|nr:sugar nucleotide-binding protein [Alphaproteobacteria bacterium]